MHTQRSIKMAVLNNGQIISIWQLGLSGMAMVQIIKRSKYQTLNYIQSRISELFFE